MRNYLALIIASTAVIIFTLLFTLRIAADLKNYESKKMEVAEMLSVENRMGDAWEWIPVDFLSPGDEKMEQKGELEERAKHFYSKAVVDGWILLAVVIVFLASITIIYRTSSLYYHSVGVALVIASFCFLYLGLSSPFMEIEAYIDDFGVSMDLSFAQPELGIEGRVYALYQMKSVAALIKFLYLGGNFFVAIVILFASVVFPLIKLFSSLVVFIWPGSKYSKEAIWVIGKLGKWSMADVMVASIFLAFFSFANMNVGVETGSSTLIGLYFYVAFVVFSIFSGYYLKKVTSDVSARKKEADHTLA